MAFRQKQWAHKIKSELKKLMGSECVNCGSKYKLQFDCIKPQGHMHHRCDYSMRISFYRKQFLVGNLQLLCEQCHIVKTRIDNLRALKERNSKEVF